MGVRDMCAGGPVGVGDMWVWGTCGCRGHVGVGDMRVLGTYGSGGHEGVGDLYSGGLVCLILEGSIPSPKISAIQYHPKIQNSTINNTLITSLDRRLYRNCNCHPYGYAGAAAKLLL